MKTITSLFITALICLFSFLAHAETEEFKVGVFTELSLRVDADLYFEQGDKQQVSITAGNEALDKIIVEVKNRKLIIRFGLDTKFQTNNFGPISIKVVAPQMEMLSISGSGNILVEELLSARIIEMNVTGSGNIKLANLKSDKVMCSISGSGDIVFSGEPGQELEVKINGSGDLKASMMEFEDANVWVAGSGDCDIHVNNYLKAKIVGSGNVTYFGNPDVDTMITGSGRVKSGE